MISVTRLIQIVLGLMQLANWITSKIDQREWKKQGYEEAMREQMQIMNQILGTADQSVEEAKNATADERHKSLEDPS